jgi:hypothetical protein
MAVVSWLRVAEGRYHVAAWNQFYPVFVILIKNNVEEAKLFNLSP